SVMARMLIFATSFTPRIGVCPQILHKNPLSPQYHEGTNPPLARRAFTELCCDEADFEWSCHCGDGRAAFRNHSCVYLQRRTCAPDNGRRVLRLHASYGRPGRLSSSCNA